MSKQLITTKEKTLPGTLLNIHLVCRLYSVHAYMKLQVVCHRWCIYKFTKLMYIHVYMYMYMYMYLYVQCISVLHNVHMNLSKYTHVWDNTCTTVCTCSCIYI